MKRNVIFILLSILLYHLLGHIAMFTFLKRQHRQIVQSILSEQIAIPSLTKFKFSLQDFSAHSKEFEHQGHLYDVVRTERVQDSIYVYCWDDIYEKKLTQQYHQHLSQILAQDIDFQHQTQLIFKFFIKDFLFEAYFQLYVFRETSPQPTAWAFLWILKTNDLNPNSPPPKRARITVS